MAEVIPIRGSLLNKTNPFARGLIGSWMLNEGSGKTVIDSSGSNNSGTFVGTAPTWTAGKLGFAVLLPGTDEYIDVSGVVGQISKAQGTLVIWCTIDTADLSDGNHHNLFGIGYSGDNDDNIMIRKSDADTIFVRYRKDDVSVFATINDISGLTGLHQYVATWGGGNLSLYLDGVFQESNTINTITGTLDLGFIGEVPVGGAASTALNGLVEAAFVYSRNLSAFEIGSIYRMKFPMFGLRVRSELFFIPAVVEPTVVARQRSNVGFRPIEGANRLRGLRRNAWY